MARLRTDWILFLTIVAMVFFGLVMLYSASSAVAELRYHVAPYYFVVRQIFWAFVSFLVLMYFKRTDYRRMNSPTKNFHPISRRLIIGGGLLLVIFAACVLTLPLTLNRHSNLYFDQQHAHSGQLAPDSSQLWMWFGTTKLGQSLLGRCLAGGVISLLIGIAAAAISVVLGVAVGVVVAVVERWGDAGG